MSSLRMQRVSFAYAGGAHVLSNLELSFVPGWTGIVGANGAGKSTLLLLAAGQLTPTHGTVPVEPAGARVVYCSQAVEHLAPSIRALAEATERQARRVMGQLKLDPLALTRWPTLSPGERKRWQIAAALTREPDVLLLDEPTNHLDAEGAGWLSRALERFHGVGVVVSHDRSLLEALTQRTVRLRQGRATLYAGAYGAAKQAWEAEAREQAAGWRREKEAVERRTAVLAQARHRRAEVQRARSGKHLDRHDSDSRTLGAKFRIESAEKRAGRSVQVARAVLESAQEKLDAVSFPVELGRDIAVRCERPPRHWLIRPEGERAGVTRDDRLWLVGPNGAGKSTLLHDWVRRWELPRARLLFLPQELTEQERREVLEHVRALPPDERGAVLSLLAALGVDPGAALQSSLPSLGEARKLQMALGLGTGAWALFLDEPTNHLDLPSIERLEQALRAYPGTLVAATHDARFARALALQPRTV